jgi:acetolactate synthase-1/3 small subunit
MTLECTGNEGKINAFEETLRPYGIKELVRTGKIAMLRGSRFGGVSGSGRNSDDE